MFRHGFLVKNRYLAILYRPDQQQTETQMLAKRNKPMPQDVLDALPADYYVIDLENKVILQTNSTTTKAGLPCYNALFNKENACDVADGECICQKSFFIKNKPEFYISGIRCGKTKHYKARATLLEKNIALVTLEDETEFLSKKEEFTQNSERLERAEKLAHFGYWEFDRKTKTFSTSVGGRLIYGIDTTILTRDELRSFNLEEYNELFDVSLTKLIEKNESIDIKFKIRRKNDGGIRTIRAIATSSLKSDVVFGIVHDITDSERFGTIEQEHQEYLSLLFENMTSAFGQHQVITGKDGKVVDVIIIDVNLRYEELFGLKKEDILNRSIKAIYPNIGSEWLERFGEVALTGKSDMLTHYVASLKKYFEIALYSPGKGYFVSSINDVTQRIESEIELKAAKEKAVESDSLKTLFLANMSHEIRTPLNGILGFSNLLSHKGLTNENRLYYGKIIENSGKRLMAIIDDIIDVSMIQSDQIKIDYTETDVKELLQEVFVFYLNERAEKLTRINFELTNRDNEDSLLMYSDKARIFQLLSNLLDNAFKFTELGKIEFGVSAVDNDQIEFFVKDTGVGIKKDKHANIFDSFRQAEEGAARSHEGFGLGLAIVTGIVDKLNGKILFNSVYGKGSEFKVILPRNSRRLSTDHMNNQKPEENERNEPLVENRKRVVSFEDEQVSAELLRTVIQQRGYEAINFADAKEGIAYIRKHSADLILMDVRLPDINGYEATRIIKAEFPEIPVIIQTAFAMAQDRKAAFEAGCDDLMAKPLRIDVIRRKLDKFLIAVD